MLVDKHPRKVFFLLCILIIPAISSGQVKNDKLLSQIPPQFRERFVERLKLYFDLKRTHQYEDLYELLSERYSGVTRQKPRKDEFIKKNQEIDAQARNAVPLKWKITRVKKELDDRGNETYFVLVEMRARYGERSIEDDKAYFEARVENGDWYFREYYVEHLK